jgi:hypothetical protein
MTSNARADLKLFRKRRSVATGVLQADSHRSSLTHASKDVRVDPPLFEPKLPRRGRGGDEGSRGGLSHWGELLKVIVEPRSTPRPCSRRLMLFCRHHRSTKPWYAQRNTRLSAPRNAVPIRPVKRWPRRETAFDSFRY